MMGIDELGKMQEMSNYEEAGKDNCEDPKRINIKAVHQQFGVNPLFNRQMQMFDSNSLDQLLLNAFPIKEDLLVEVVQYKER